MLKYLKGLVASFLAAGVIVLGAGSAMAFGHYTPGSLGLNAATLPPEGFHYTCTTCSTTPTP